MLDNLNRGIQLPYQIIQTLKFPENVRKVFELVTFAFGFIGLYDMVKNFCLENRDISQSHENFTRSEQIVFRYANLFGNISLILDAVKSEPAISAWKWSVKQLFSHQELERFFNCGGLFPTKNLNRTVAIISFFCRLPSTLTTLYRIYKWYTSRSPETNLEERKSHTYNLIIQLKNTYITLMTVSETATTLLNQTPKK